MTPPAACQPGQSLSEYKFKQCTYTAQHGAAGCRAIADQARQPCLGHSRPRLCYLCSTAAHACRAAACPLAGIFVSDILDAVPIDKYFELFKPSAGGEGGFIRLGLDFVKDPAELSRARGGAISFCTLLSILQLQPRQMLLQSLHADYSSYRSMRQDVMGARHLGSSSSPAGRGLALVLAEDGTAVAGANVPIVWRPT